MLWSSYLRVLRGRGWRRGGLFLTILIIFQGTSRRLLSKTRLIPSSCLIENCNHSNKPTFIMIQSPGVLSCKFINYTRLSTRQADPFITYIILIMPIIHIIPPIKHIINTCHHYYTHTTTTLAPSPLPFIVV